MNSVTTTLTTASATKATTAPQKLADSPDPKVNSSGSSNPKLSTPLSEVTKMNAPAVPAIRPAMPAAEVMRFQNMPMMKVANSGTLKNENSVWM